MDTVKAYLKEIEIQIKNVRTEYISIEEVDASRQQLEYYRHQIQDFLELAPENLKTANRLNSLIERKKRRLEKVRQNFQIYGTPQRRAGIWITGISATVIMALAVALLYFAISRELTASLLGALIILVGQTSVIVINHKKNEYFRIQLYE